MSKPSERERFSRVLVVEDNESQRRTITDLLRKEGFDVVACSTTAAAFEHISGEDFGVAVLDLRLPDEPGIKLLARIRECNGRIRVIINTAFGSFDTAKLAINLGAFAYVEKAGNPEELLRCVHAAARANLDLYATDLEGVVAERTKELRDANEELKREIAERARVEDALRDSSERFRLLYERAPIGYQSLDERGHFVEVNPAWLDILGYSREEVIGRWFGDFLTPRYVEHFKRDFPCFRAAGEIHQVRFEMIRKDGSRILVEYEGKIGYDEDGEFEKTHCVLQDITERQRAEEALRESEERFQLAVRGTSDGLWDWEVATGDVWWSPRYRELIGYEDGELPATYASWESLLHPDDRERALEAVRQHFEEGLAFDIVYRLKTKNDGYRWFLARGVAARDESGKPMRMAGSIQDITERKASDERLRFLGLITEQVSDSVIATNLDYEVTYANRSFRDLYGYSSEEIVGQSPGLMNAEPTAEQSQSEIYETVSSGRTWRGELLNRRKDGTLFNCELTVFPLADEQGNAFAYAGIQRDITERKRAEEEKERLEVQLRQALKMEAVGQLAGGVAHDFNNLLTVILGNTDMLLSTLKRDQTESTREGIRSGLEQIKHAGERAADMTNRLLTFSRKRMFRPEILELRRVLLETEKILRRLVREDIDFELAVERDIGFVRADAGQIEQVILNLVLNASDAMPKGGKLTVKCRNVYLDEAHAAAHAGAKPGKHVMIGVTDSGIGMSPETMERVFEPFFTTKPVGKGTGLGLSTVYGIVTQGGGHVSVESEPDRGSTFTAYFPAVGQGAVVAEDGGDVAHGGSEVVLLCEDEDMVREVTSRVLRDSGYEVLEASNGKRALEVAADHEGPIQLLVTDVVMPEMNGRELAEIMTADHSGLCVVFVSGYAADVIDSSMSESKQVDFIQKPFIASNLLRRIRRLLDSV